MTLKLFLHIAAQPYDDTWYFLVIFFPGTLQHLTLRIFWTPKNEKTKKKTFKQKHEIKLAMQEFKKSSTCWTHWIGSHFSSKRNTAPSASANGVLLAALSEALLWRHQVTRVERSVARAGQAPKPHKDPWDWYSTWMSQEVSKWLVNGLQPTYKWDILGL